MFLFFAAFLSFGGVVTHSKLVTHCWPFGALSTTTIHIYIHIQLIYYLYVLRLFWMPEKANAGGLLSSWLSKITQQRPFFLVFIYSCGKPLKCGISCVASASQRKHGKALSYCFLFCQTAKFDCLQSIHYNRRTAISNAC